MFFRFFDELRAAKAPITLKEYLTLIETLSTLAGLDGEMKELNR